jgi:biotin synthase
MRSILERASAAPYQLNHDEMMELLCLKDVSELFEAAYQVKLRYIGKCVSLRGLIELGNYCAKDCLYCGIRKSNLEVTRYRLPADDIIRMAQWSFDHGYGSIVLQSGEIEAEENTVFIEQILNRMRQLFGDRLGITLCLGEQTEAVYRRWRDAGAHRYLLRIETSSSKLYAQLHPTDHSFDRRKACVHLLKRIGYQTGSGVMIGLPGQTIDDLARDIQFFREMDLDMIGMGPYLPHHQTPLGKAIEFSQTDSEKQIQLALKMIAVTRLYLHDVNIASTTALQALADNGREQGLLVGANVIMPNVTDTEYRQHYQLYENKPCMNENSTQCRNCLQSRVVSVGEKILWGERGDSPHYQARSNCSNSNDGRGPC